MKNGILIKNGHIIDPIRGVDETASLLVSGEKIVWYGKRDDDLPSGEYEQIDARDLVVCPGFIDMHCHLREPGYEEKEDIDTGTRAAAKGGFTTICCMPNTNPPLDSVETVHKIKSVASSRGAVRVLPIGCISKERKGLEITDMDGLAEAGIAGFSDDGFPVVSENVMKEALRRSIRLDLPVIDHCENPAVLNSWDMNGGAIARRLGLRGMPPGAEESIIERDLALNREIGGKLHIAHVSTANSLSLIRKARQEGIRVTAEVTPHHLTMDEGQVLISDTNAKVSPPLRTKKDVEALIAGLIDNTVDIIATDHAPHTLADKERGFAEAAFGISGFETALGSLMRLVYEYGLPVGLIVEKLTLKPAEIISKIFGNPPALVAGAQADITVFNPDKSWVVNTAEFISKGKNTPLAGEMLRGKIILTIYRGRIMYKEPAIVETKGSYE